jgi:tetratricopeptide (TPR) repeat protein
MASRFSQVLKWIGYATAILSFIAAVREIEKVVADRVEARRKIDGLLASERIQTQGRDYTSAWRSLEEASQVDSGSSPVHDAQAALAMEWLENIRVRENDGFSGIAEKLEPVLTREIASASTGQRQADLLAHLGWSYFLRSREGTSGLDPAGTYAQAVKKDPNNPYAQAMWGHWILWNRPDSGEAAQHFSSALASNRQRSFVRQLQLSALLNANNSQCDREIVRVLNAVREEGGSVDRDMRREIFAVYNEEIMPSNAETTQFVNAVSPAEHVATFRWLFGTPNPGESESLPRQLYLGVLQEAAGQRDEALAAYQSIRRQTEGSPGSLSNIAEAGVKRLSKRQVRSEHSESDPQAVGR